MYHERLVHFYPYRLETVFYSPPLFPTSPRTIIVVVFPFSFMKHRKKYSEPPHRRYGGRLILRGERCETSSECIKYDSIARRWEIATRGLRMYGISTSVTSGMKRRTRSEALTKHCYMCPRVIEQRIRERLRSNSTNKNLRNKSQIRFLLRNNELSRSLFNIINIGSFDNDPTIKYRK